MHKPTFRQTGPNSGLPLAQRRPEGARLRENAAHTVFTMCACISTLAVALVCLFLFANGVPGMAKNRPVELPFRAEMESGQRSVGILPFIPGSVHVTAGALPVGVPAGLTTAPFLVPTHFPLLNRRGAYFLKLCQHRFYVLPGKTPPVSAACMWTRRKRARPFGIRNIFFCRAAAHTARGGNWQELLDFARQNYPRTQVVCQWAAQGCMSPDSPPYIGPIRPARRGCMWQRASTNGT